MRSNAQPTSSEYAARPSLWQAVLRRRGRLALLVLASGALTYGFVSMLTPEYTSSAEVLITREGQAAQQAGAGRVSAGDLLPLSDSDVASQAAVVRSPDLLSRVARELKLERLAEFNAALRPETLPDKLLRAIGFGRDEVRMNAAERVLKRLGERISVRSVASSRVIAIEASSSDSRLAAAIANKLAETYIAWTQLGQLRKGTGEAETLGGQLAKLKEEADAADAALAAYRAKAGVLAGQGQLAVNAQRLAEVTAQLTQARAARVEAETRVRVVRELLEAGEVESSPEVLRSPLFQRLLESRIEIERRLAELSTTLLPGHPRMRQLYSELATLKSQIRGEGLKVVRGIEREVAVAASRERTLEESIATFASEAERSDAAQVHLAVLGEEARNRRALYESTLGRYDEARVRHDESPAPALAKLISTARPAALPAFPQTMPATLAAMALSLVAGVAMIAVGRTVNGARGRPIERLPMAPSAAAGPEPVPAPRPGRLPEQVNRQPQGERPAASAPSPARRAKPAEPAPRARASIIACRSVDAVARHLAKLAREERGGQSLQTLIVDGDGGEALDEKASQIAASLASDGGPVMLVSLTGIGQGAPGFLDLLRGTATYEDVIRSDAASDLHRIAVGTSTAEIEASRLLEGAGRVLEALNGIYRHVLIAAGPRDAEDLLVALAGGLGAGVSIEEGPVHPEAATDRSFLGLADPGFEVIRLVPAHIVSGESFDVDAASQSVASVVQRMRDRAASLKQAG